MTSRREEYQERYHEYIKRMEKEMLTDEQMIEKLRTQAHWTTEQPWKQIADRFEELLKESKS